MTNVFALLRLLPASDQDKDVEILALRHQIAVLERQLGKTRPRFSPGDRVFLAALLHRLPRNVLAGFRLLVRPETVLRWHRDLLARRHAARSRPKRPGRPHAIPPGGLPVDRTNQATNDPAPSLRPRCRDFTATTNRSASASRDGTRPLAVQPLGVLPARRPQDGDQPVSGRAFSCSVRKPQTGLASSTCRTPPGQ